MFWDKKEEVKENPRELYVKLNGEIITESQIDAMNVSEIDRLIVKLDMAIDECQGRIESLEDEGIEDDRLLKTRTALKKLQQGRTLALAVKRTKTGTVKLDIEHYFMRIAKRELNENQYNRILVKAQAEYEVENN